MSEYIYEQPDEPAKIVRDGWNVRVEWAFKQHEEIVRCRDCREYNTELYRHINCELLGRYVEPYGFCAWGERKGE